jgi:hypothetical protein
MGNSSSSSVDTNALEQFYSHLHDTQVHGGKSDEVDKKKYLSLESYGNSLYSEAKEKLIRGIAGDVASLLKVSKAFADTANINAVVQQLKKIVPNPRDKRSIKSNAGVHKELCNKLADSINNRYGIQIIDKTASHDIVCNKVAEVLYSLFNGLHSEFLTISGDVTRTIKNLQILQDFVDSANKKLIVEVEKRTDVEDVEAQSIRALYEKLSQEIGRQQTILSNLVDSTIGPVGDSLITLLDDNENFGPLTKDLKDMAGTADFGAKLGYILNGTSAIAYTAKMVDEALKKIGMSVAEYKTTDGDLKKLYEKVYDSIARKKPSNEELYKMLAAANIIIANDTSHDDIIAFLSKKKGGALFEDSHDEAFLSAADINSAMDVDVSPLAGRTQSTRKSITKQIANQAKLRRQLFITLNTKIKNTYEKIKHSLGYLGKKIGNEVPITDQLADFITSLVKFSDIQLEKENLIGSLSGYKQDLESNIKRYQFMSSLLDLSEAIAPLLNKEGGSAFKEIKQNVDSLIQIITDFTNTFGETLGAIHIEPIGTKKGHGGMGFSNVEDIAGIGGMDFSEVDDIAEIGGKDYDEVEDIGGSPKRKYDEDEVDDEVENVETIAEIPDEDMMNEDVALGVDDDEYGGGAVESADLKRHIADIIRSLPESNFSHYKTMDKSIREINYYYKIAGIKQSIKKTSNEFEYNTDNYVNILGEEAGYQIDKIQKRHNALIKALGTDEDAIKAAKDNNLYSSLPTTSVPDTNEVNAIFKTPLGKHLAEIKGAVAENAKPVIDSYERGYIFLLEYIRSSKVEMLEAAQALDLYLSKFTQSMQSDPDQIKEFLQILEQIEVVAKWFTDKSGDKLAGVFEAFPTATDKFDVGKVYGSEDFYVVDPNDRPDKCYNELEGDYKVPDNQHYYTKFNEANHKAGIFYNPRLMTREQAVNFVKQIEQSIKSVRALENIIATFSRINTSVSAEVRTFMSSGLMFKAFMKYMVASSIAIGYNILNDNELLVNNAEYNNAYNNAYRKMAVSLNFNKSLVVLDGARKLILCNPLSDPENLIDSEYLANPRTENKKQDFCDKIFEMSIKSLIAKIFTIVGSYSLFNKPAKYQVDSAVFATNPVRQILGGNNKQSIRIYPEITELYIRLPLLVEWYRSIFEFTPTEGNEMTGVYAANDAARAYVRELPGVRYAPRARRDMPNYTQQANPLISIIPDMDSIWGDLCRIIFFDSVNITDGAYPAEYANRIINAINKVYNYYKSKDSKISCRHIIDEFVIEINRRYGLIMREEINAYLSEKYSYVTDDVDYPDYDILDVEAQIGRTSAPSDRFRSLGKTKPPRKSTIQDLLKAADRFRNAIDNNLRIYNDAGIINNDWSNQVADVSLYNLIKEVKKDAEHSSTDEERYKIIHSQLHGMNRYDDIDKSKLIMFHETVITPLTVLYYVYAALNKFNKFFISFTGYADGATVDTLKQSINKHFRGKGNPYKPADWATDQFIIMNQAALDTLVAMTPNELLTKLMEELQLVGCDMNGLTEISFGGNNYFPIFIYDKLEAMCAELLVNTKSALKYLRKYIPNALLNRYESDDKNVSLFFIEEHLMKRLFNNKYGNGLVDSNMGLKKLWENLNNRNESYGKTMRTAILWNIDIGNVYATNIKLKMQSFPYGYIEIFNSGASAIGTTRREEQNVVNKMLIDVGVLSVSEQNLLNKKILKIDGSNYYLGSEYLYNIDDSTYNPTIHPNLGLVCKLNALIYKYCNMFIDKGNKKIYKPLLENFINGHNAKDIIASKNINDNFYDGLYTRVFKTEPQKDSVLFASIASGLKSLIMTRSTNLVGTSSLFMEDNIIDVSEYQKELMRAYLPTFEKEFNLLIRRAEFIKTLLENANINVAYQAVTDDTIDAVRAAANARAVAARDRFHAARARVDIANARVDAANARVDIANARVDAANARVDIANARADAANATIDATITAAINVDIIDEKYTQKNIVPPVNISHAQRRIDLVNIVNDVIMSAKSMLKCINTVQKDLPDVPLYFETYKESIIDYNNVNNTIPFMPISNITYLMNANSSTQSNIDIVLENGIQVEHEIVMKYNDEINLCIIPTSNIVFGTPNFKFTYGTRGLLSYKQDPSIEYTPGITDMLKKYNSRMTDGAKFDGKLMADLTKNTVMLSRWTIDNMYHNQVVGGHAWDDIRHYTTKTVSNVKNLSCQTARSGDHPNYKIWSNISLITLSAEIDSYRQVLERILGCIAGTDVPTISKTSRSNSRVYNILDLNVVPINIHAMQREIPFVNLSNYAYTFNQIIKNFIGYKTKNKAITGIRKNDDNNIQDDPRDIIVAYTIHPLGDRSIKNYYNGVFRIMNGTAELSLGKPKYLSDQLWNKVLLNQFYNLGDNLIGPKPIESAYGNFNHLFRGDILRSPYIITNTDLMIGNLGLVRTITYVDSKPEVRNVNLATETPESLVYKGYLRYNSKLVRWIEWSVQIQRIIRMIMRQQLDWVSDPVVQGNEAISREITEYRDDEVFSVDIYN